MALSCRARVVSGTRTRDCESEHGAGVLQRAPGRHDGNAARFANRDRQRVAPAEPVSAGSRNSYAPTATVTFGEDKDALCFSDGDGSPSHSGSGCGGNAEEKPPARR